MYHPPHSVPRVGLSAESLQHRGLGWMRGRRWEAGGQFTKTGELGHDLGPLSWYQAREASAGGCGLPWCPWLVDTAFQPRWSLSLLQVSGSRVPSSLKDTGH